MATRSESGQSLIALALLYIEVSADGLEVELEALLTRTFQ